MRFPADRQHHRVQATARDVNLLEELSGGRALAATTSGFW